MKMKMNKSMTTAGSILIGVGLSAAAVYAVAPKVKNLANNMSNMTNKKPMSNDNNNNSTTFDKNSMY